MAVGDRPAHEGVGRDLLERRLVESPTLRTDERAVPALSVNSRYVSAAAADSVVVGKSPASAVVGIRQRHLAVAGE